jgi:hypothetical protein
LRHRWIPVLRQQLGHDPAGPLVRFAALQQQDQSLLWELAAEAAEACGLYPGAGQAQGACPDASLQSGAVTSPTKVSWSASGLSGLPDALARRVVLLAWERLTGTRADLETVHVEAVLRLCRSGKAKGHLDLPHRTVAVLSGDCCLLQASAEKGRQEMVCWSHPVEVPQHVGESSRTQVPEADGVLIVTGLVLTRPVTCFRT